MAIKAERFPPYFMPIKDALNLSHCGLTYPGNPQFTLQELAEFLFTKSRVKAVKVCRELHQNGNPHFHAYVVFSSRTKFSPATYFNFQGHHPNIKKFKEHTGCPKEWIEYLDKDGDTIILPEGFDFNPPSKRSFAHVAKDAIAAPSKKAAIDIIIRDNPDKYLLYSDNIERSLDKLFKPERRQFQARPLESFRIPAAVNQWVSGNLQHPRPERPKCLILVGASRLGKTQLARAFGDHIYVCNMWSVDDFMGWDWSGYVVFDDIPWKSLVNSYKAWMGAQRDFYVTDKYRKKCRMEGGAPLILCCNQKEYEEYQKEWDTDWVFCNTVVVTIGEKLY